MDWLQTLREVRVSSFWTGLRTFRDSSGLEQTCVSLITQVPSQSVGASGAVVINLDDDSIYQNMLISQSRKNFSVWTVDGEGNLFLGKTQELKDWAYDNQWIIDAMSDSGSRTFLTGNQKILQTFVYAPQLDWYFVCSSSIDTSIESYVDLPVTGILFLISLLLGVFLAYLASKGIYRPVRDLVINVVVTSPFPMNTRR